VALSGPQTILRNVETNPSLATQRKYKNFISNHDKVSAAVR
jgi:hypothetical protein